MNPLFVGPPRPRLDSRMRRRVAEKRQQRTAIKAWEDEGGSLAVPVAEDCRARLLQPI
jgi:hypothetical protein